MLAQERADDEAEELQAELFGVEGEFVLQELGHFDGVEDRGEEENHAVGDCGEEDGDVGEEGERVQELGRCEGGWIDSGEGQVFTFEGRRGRAGVSRFGAEEDV